MERVDGVPVVLVPDARSAEIDPAAAGDKLQARQVSMTFRVGGRPLPALRDVTVSAVAGEFVSILGPSGCGKSTFFNILAGLITPVSGTVRLDGRDITGRVGQVGYMPQKDLLMPWKTVLDNTVIGLELLGVSRRAARREAQQLFPRFGLAGFERQYPARLSGGMRQRAALLRTILARREVLLLDEPFGALDAITRADMQAWLLDIWASFGKTIIFVTHDVDEAIYLSDRVYVMSPRPGSIVATRHVPLLRPRQYEEVVTSPVFTALKRELLAALRQPAPIPAARPSTPVARPSTPVARSSVAETGGALRHNRGAGGESGPGREQ